MTTQNQTSFAVLASQITTLASTHPVAILSLDLSADSDGWQQLLPAGHFKAIDGRPFDVPGGHWFLDESIANSLIVNAQAAANDLVIDYEHQTLYSEQNGQPAPAAGWFHGAAEMQWRQPDANHQGGGLWIKPRWTDRARDFIHNNEYRYLSAVFPYDKATGEPLSLHSVALVNRPGVDGMQAVAALNARLSLQYQQDQRQHSKEIVMNEHLRKLLAKLGITIADGSDMTEAQASAALSALDTLQADAGRSGALATELAALKAKAPATGQTDVDLSLYVPAATYNALVTEMATLKAGTELDTADRLITTARQEGKVLAAEVDYLGRFAKQQGVAALKALIDARPAVAALKGQQTDATDTQKDLGKDTDSHLTSEELAMCKAMDMTPEAFLQAKG